MNVPDMLGLSYIKVHVYRETYVRSVLGCQKVPNGNQCNSQAVEAAQDQWAQRRRERCIVAVDQSRLQVCTCFLNWKEIILMRGVCVSPPCCAVLSVHLMLQVEWMRVTHNSKFTLEGEPFPLTWKLISTADMGRLLNV